MAENVTDGEESVIASGVHPLSPLDRFGKFQSVENAKENVEQI